jgi:hypothetical protein
MKRKKRIFWSLFLPIQPRRILLKVAEDIKVNNIDKQLNIYKVIQSILFGIMCCMSSILLMNLIEDILPLYIDRGGYDWINVYLRVKIIIPVIFFIMGIILVNLNYFLLHFFTFIDETIHPIDPRMFKKALIIGYADLSSTIIFIILLSLMTIRKRDTFLNCFITRNMDQYTVQEQIILTFYKPIIFIILFLILKTVIQLNSARKCAVIMEHIVSKKDIFVTSMKLAVISIFLKKALFIALCLLVLSTIIYFSQYITAEFITIQK